MSGTTFYPEPFKKPKRKHRKMTYAKRKRRERNRQIADLDADCRQKVVVVRDWNTCQYCGKTADQAVMQWAHVQSREYHVTRWEEFNSLALCRDCHKWFDNHKVESYDWFAKKFPERWAALVRVLGYHSCATPKTYVRERWAELAGESGK